MSRGQKETRHWEGREEEMRETSRKEGESREKTQREKEMEGKRLIQGSFFIKFQPKEAVYRDFPFSPSEA